MSSDQRGLTKRLWMLESRLEVRKMYKDIKVILIGGSPMSGKTTLALKLAAKYEYGCVSTDDIG